METDLFNSIIISVIPIVFGIIIPFVDFFNIGYKESDVYFKKKTKSVKKEKLDILDRIVMINGNNYIDQLSQNAVGLGGDYMEGLLEKIEKVLLFEKKLNHCVKIFNIYYCSFIIIFAFGVISSSLLYIYDYNFFNYFTSYGIDSRKVLILVIVYFLIASLYFFIIKKKLENKYGEPSI